MPSLFFLSLMNGAAWGGSEELWFRTAIYAAGKNHKVACAFYYWNEKEEKIEALKKAGCQVYLLPNKGRTKKNLLEKIRLLNLVKSSCPLFLFPQLILIVTLLRDERDTTS